MMTLADITIVVPVRGRPALAQALARAVSHRPFIFIVDQDRRADGPAELLGAAVLESWTAGVIPAVHFGIAQAQTRLVCLLNDDVEFFPDGSMESRPTDDWLEEALRVYNERIGDGDGVVSINDGAEGRTACIPLLSRAFHLKHCMDAPYERWSLDDEWAAKAKHLGVYAYAEKARVRHLHITPAGAETAARDVALFRRRMEEFYASVL